VGSGQLQGESKFDRKQASTEVLKSRFHKYVTNSHYGVMRAASHSLNAPWAVVVAKGLSTTGC